MNIPYETRVSITAIVIRTFCMFCSFCHLRFWSLQSITQYGQAIRERLWKRRNVCCSIIDTTGTKPRNRHVSFVYVRVHTNVCDFCCICNLSLSLSLFCFSRLQVVNVTHVRCFLYVSHHLFYRYVHTCFSIDFFLLYKQPKSQYSNIEMIESVVNWRMWSRMQGICQRVR